MVLLQTLRHPVRGRRLIGTAVLGEISPHHLGLPADGTDHAVITTLDLAPDADPISTPSSPSALSVVR